MTALRSLALAVSLAAVAANASCFDPVHDDAIAALGPEAPGVPTGPLHRPGQPCLTCHGGRGPGSPDMAMGGTIYAARGGTAPASNVTVLLIDANGDTQERVTNDVGNFYLWKDEWSPVYPVIASISQGSLGQVMNSRIGRSGSCAECHVGSGGNDHMPAIYLTDPR